VLKLRKIIQGVSVNYCHFQLNSALAIANLFILKQCQSNKQGLEFHIWVALWMTCSMWAPWVSQTAWRRNANSVQHGWAFLLWPVHNFHLFSPSVQAEFGEHCWTLCPSDNPRGSNHTDLKMDCRVAMRIRTGIAVGNDWTLCDAGTWSAGLPGPLEWCEV